MPNKLIDSIGVGNGLDVTMGRVPNHSVVNKFGINHAVRVVTTPEDIWEYGGLYIYDADGTAPIVSLVSDDPVDIQTITIVGLDIFGNEVSQDITLTGTTRAALTTPLWRVYRMTNISSTGIAGMVYCYIGIGNVPDIDAIRAVIDNGHNQTLMCLITIPKGKVGFLFQGELGMQYNKGGVATHEFAHCHYTSRRLGQVFTVKKSVTLLSNGNSIYQDKRSFPDVIPALTDLKISVIEVSDDMGMFGTLDILLVDESQFSESYLKSIGQPREI